MWCFFVGVPADTPTILIYRTIRVQWWRRQTGWDISRSNTGILNPRLFRSSSDFHFNIDMSVIAVKNEIKRQGWINNRGDLNPRLIQWYSKFLFNLVLSVIMVNDEIRRQGWIEISGNDNPWLFDHLHFLPGIKSQPACLRQIPCPFLHIFRGESLVYFL